MLWLREDLSLEIRRVLCHHGAETREGSIPFPDQSYLFRFLCFPTTFPIQVP